MSQLKDMNDIPDEEDKLQEYIEECYLDLSKYTSDYSQQVIKERIQRAELKQSKVKIHYEHTERNRR